MRVNMSCFGDNFSTAHAEAVENFLKENRLAKEDSKVYCIDSLVAEKYVLFL